MKRDLHVPFITPPPSAYSRTTPSSRRDDRGQLCTRRAFLVHIRYAFVWVYREINKNPNNKQRIIKKIVSVYSSQNIYQKQ